MQVFKLIIMFYIDKSIFEFLKIMAKKKLEINCYYLKSRKKPIKRVKKSFKDGKKEEKEVLIFIYFIKKQFGY